MGPPSRRMPLYDPAAHDKAISVCTAENPWAGTFSSPLLWEHPDAVPVRRIGYTATICRHCGQVIGVSTP